MTLAVGFLGAGIGPLMPFWFTVIGMNAVLLAAGLFFYSGIRAFVTIQPPRFDRVGAMLVLLAMPFFAHWGFVEPDGFRRSVVFSVFSAMIYGRIAWLLVMHLRRHAYRWSLLFITAAFVIFTVWMLVRGVVLLWASPVPLEAKAANPTSWQTVFAFNVLVSVFVASLLTTEVQAQSQPVQQDAIEGEAVRGNLQMLWGVVVVVLLAILSETGIAYLVLYQREQQQLKDQNSLTNQALVEHAQQLLDRVDLVLRATRDLAQKDYPLQSLEQFVNHLPIPQQVMGDVYLIDDAGRIVLPHRQRGSSLNTHLSEAVKFHQSESKDVLHVGSLSVGQNTSNLEFCLSRSMSDAQGHFSGVVLVSLESSVLTHYYGKLISSADGVAALLGDEDHRLRARFPEATKSMLEQPVSSSMLGLLHGESGDFAARSMFDGVDRQYFYRRLKGVPLVMVTGFSDADVHRNALQNLKPIALGALLAIAVVLAMAFILASAMRRRDEQDRFLSMISHELRTPLSVVRMVAGTMPEVTQARVVRAVNDMSAIIESALQTDRLHHGRVHPQLSTFELDQLLNTLWQSSSAPERVQIDACMLGPVRTDQQLLKVVLGNLIDNALKYSSSDTLVRVKITIENFHGTAGVCFSVSNSVGSVGLPDPHQLFSKFYRAPGARGKTGSGLGLHIADGMARLLGGHLKYFASGDTVHFTLWIPV